MAAAIFHTKPVIKTIIEDTFNKSKGFIRNVSNKRGVHKKDHGEPSHFGPKKKNGEIVKASTILFNQINLQAVPGLNVGIGKIAKLYAKVPGELVISCEKTNFKPDSFLVKSSFPDFPPVYKRYLNVIPEPMHRRFKLVEKF